jgi:hypothetical protein
MKFTKGQQVRQRGKHQVMEVIGEAGLSATHHAIVTRRAMIASVWVTPRGKRIQRAFAEPVASHPSDTH